MSSIVPKQLKEVPPKHEIELNQELAQILQRVETCLLEVRSFPFGRSISQVDQEALAQRKITWLSLKNKELSKCLLQIQKMTNLQSNL